MINLLRPQYYGVIYNFNFKDLVLRQPNFVLFENYRLVGMKLCNLSIITEF